MLMALLRPGTLEWSQACINRERGGVQDPRGVIFEHVSSGGFRHAANLGSQVSQFRAGATPASRPLRQNIESQPGAIVPSSVRAAGLPRQPCPLMADGPAARALAELSLALEPGHVFPVDTCQRVPRRHIRPTWSAWHSNPAYSRTFASWRAHMLEFIQGAGVQPVSLFPTPSLHPCGSFSFPLSLSTSRGVCVCMYCIAAHTDMNPHMLYWSINAPI